MQTPNLTANQFIKMLEALSTPEQVDKIQRYFKSGEGDYGEGDIFIGVPMGKLFELAKQFADIPIGEIEQLLESPIHEVRAGAISIMDKASRSKKISDARLAEFYNLYMRRHDRVNNWDLVDLGCLYMTGRYLFDKPREVLYTMAASLNLWERRTAILSTCYFIRQSDLDDTFKITEILLTDDQDLVHKAAGWMLRFAGDKDMQRLLQFLDAHAATMPRVMLRNAIEKMEKPQREHYLKMK